MISSHNMLLHLAAIIVGTLSILVTQSIGVETKSNTFHLSWTVKNQSRYDIVFSPKLPIKNDIKLESLAANSTIEKSLLSCTGYNACLLQDGNYVVGYNLVVTNNTDKIQFKNPKPSNGCTNQILINTYCNTHWNPPVHHLGDKNHCSHSLSWHSPYSCHSNSTNYEHPCYTYDAAGNLIDLTPWIISNGSSYQVDISSFNKTIRQFNLNVCNDAHETCGPNVSSCYSDSKTTVESGYINSTSIKYDAKDKAVLLSSFGEYNARCPDNRVRTIVRFICKNKVMTHPKPILIKSDACENIIEWQTIHACPLSEISAPATKCSLKYQPLGIDLNLTQLVGDTSVEVNDINLGKEKKTMILGLCKGITKGELKSCGGKQVSTATACLIDGNRKNSTKSEVISSITKSNLRLMDSRLYLESYSVDKTCQVPMGRDFNLTSKVGTRIEFFCAPENYDKPRFIGVEQCVYVFEWAWKSMCLESLGVSGKNESFSSIATSIVNTNTTKNDKTKLSDKDLKIDLSEDKKIAQEAHDENVKEAQEMINTAALNRSKVIVEKTHTSKSDSSQIISGSTSTVAPVIHKASSEPKQVPMNNNRMDKLHKFFMIGLIVMSLAAFIVVIFILDRKTQLRIPLTNIRRSARRAFQPPPVPYTRVGQFNDLDLS